MCKYENNIEKLSSILKKLLLNNMFKIDNHKIGSSKVFIIAEIGINHNGNIVLCKKLIKQAKLSGADAVNFKFQIQNIVMKNTPSYKYSKNKLSFSELKKIKKFCKSLDHLICNTWHSKV